LLDLRLLLVSATASEIEFLTWKAELNRLGVPYDTLVATEEAPLTPARLVNENGSGRYQAIFLTTNNLAYDGGGGTFVSAFSNDEWTALFAYELDYGVRQVALYGAPTTFPEDYCTRVSGVEAVQGTDYPVRLTQEGADTFSYLKPTAQIPLRFSYVYKTNLDAACLVETDTLPLLEDSSGSALAVVSVSPDGRERMMLSFSSNPFFLYTPMLSYGVVRWATRGVFVGELQRFLNVDVDDWFNVTDWRLKDGSFVPGGFRLSASDAVSVNRIQRAFRRQWGGVLDERDSAFSINIAANLEGAVPTARVGCRAQISSTDPLTSVSRCLQSNFRWINHSYTHRNLDQTTGATYEVAKDQIQLNLQAANQMALPMPAAVFKSGELSGLGFYDPNRTDPLGGLAQQPRDFGLGASNREFLRAAKDSGVRYIHANFSVPSQKPGCANCGIWHPLEPSLFLIPVRPNNVAYYVTTPDEEASFFNYFYGPAGLFPFFTRDQSYQEVLNYESELALFEVVRGTAYAHYFHQGNLREYAPGKNLVFDWLGAVMTRYNQYFEAPVRDLPWSGLGGLGSYIEARTSHSALAPKLKATWNPTARTVTFSAPAGQGGSFFVTGLGTPGSLLYGDDRISELSLNAGQVLSVGPVLANK
jgi:hypothetical protein